MVTRFFSITDKVCDLYCPVYEYFNIMTHSRVHSSVGRLIFDLTGNIRYGFFFLVAMVWAAIPLLLLVDVEKGRDDAEAYSISDDDERAVGEN